MESYVFFALKLREISYTRTQLSNITREINKLMPMPAMIIFQHGQTVTLAVINRRLHKRDESKDVLEKVTLIKDIDSHDPHPAHIKILFDLSRNELFRVHGFSNFVELHRAWAKTLDIQALNKRFYRELSNWYFWAVDNVTFPEDAGENVDIRNATSIIRLITRLIFVWFIKQKKLVPDIFFNLREIEKILISTDPQESTYYKAILQNLFFATLNQEMNTAEKSDIRKFRGKGRQHYNITSLYRYEENFTNSDKALRHFETIPFLNGGLFECLDKGDKDDPKKILRIDGFSDRADNQLSIPNFLFFAEEREVDLNKVYDTKGKRYKVRGLIEILRRYKFTITENTPIEEEVALDPELLGKVFENLLAAYNPETGATARKQTGSFYTPREIVNYMVDESLIAYLKSELVTYYESESTFASISPPSQLDLSGRADPVQTGLDTQKTVLSDKQKSDIEKKLRHLIAYKDELHQFDADGTEQLIKAIDTFKILDPACGSGAFPMGILHKLVFILGKLDPRNDQWRQRQIAKVENLINIAEGIDDSTVRENTIRDLETEIDSINEAFERNELDYGRKLYLIENCIYGVDIQPVAVQIAKLRFFISLVVDQRIDDAQENRGVRPLPNLETKFVSGNTLISVEKPVQQTLRNPEIDRKETELSEVRRKHFTARTPRTKEKYRNLDKQIRADISQLLKRGGFPSETTEKIANWDPYNQNVVADFFDAEWMFGITDGFNVVIGNPPYVRQEKIKHLKSTLKKRCTCYTGAADLYVYFYERGLQLLSSNGIHTFICSNSWLDVNYGAPLQKYLLDNTAGAVICHSEAEREFESADINTIVSILQNGTPNADSQIRFLTFKTFIGDPDIENCQERTRTYTELKQAGTRENTYTGDKWGGKYLRAPDIYWTILDKGKDKLVRLGDVADVRRGFTTGANEFFYLDTERILEWGIEAEFLKSVIKSPRECKSIRVDPRQLQFKLFMCHVEKSALAGTAALDYIEWGESQGYHQRPSCRGRTRWWDLGKQPAFDWLILRFRDKRNWTPINEKPSLLAGDVVFIATLHNRDTIQSANAVANSTLGVLVSEIYGRVNLGDGLLTTYGPDILNFDFISPDWIDAQSGESLHRAFEPMKQRPVLSIFDEIHQSDRHALDAIIFDALGLTQGERNGVYEAVVNLVESRLRKARSLKGK
ncbi:MAG: Eco57I restriction-modification methylase domain-containing protein [Candidatus Poribacteria bacterium]|nr:Eco57I restriction-modification methylase domain-containing protein [Candidatus Poribacteria bacterium]